MDMNESQRLDLAGRIERERVRRHDGNRRAAYTAAKVNSATWTKAETADPTLSEGSLIRIVKSLWPETEGDWNAITPPLGAERDPEEEIRDAPVSPRTKELALRLLAEERARNEGRDPA